MASLDIYDDAEDVETTTLYQGFIRYKMLFLLACTLLLLAIVIISATIGALDIKTAEVLRHLFTLNRDGMGRVVWDIRMVRIVAAILVGASLAVSGTVMQCILRNQLASPYTLGLSSAAAFGAAFAILFLQTDVGNTSKLVVSNPYIVTLTAFCFSMIATLAILVLVKATSISAESMVLAGVAMSAIFAAGITMMQYFADSVQLANMVTWTFGDLGRATWRWNAFILAALVPISAVFIYSRWDYNAINAGDDVSRGLGINPGSVRIIGMVLSSVLCSLVVSFFGIIAFIGLLGPHISRMIIGGDHRHLIPASMLLGAMILLVSDTVSKTIMPPLVLPVGIITSMLGGPLFIFLLVRGSRR